MKRVDFKHWEHFGELGRALDGHGAFLVVAEPDGGANPMTIGWATVGRIWGKPLMTVLVRGSRHTFGLIERAATFAVCVPAAGELDDALAYCGSKSGRDGDKARACKLTLVDGQLAGTKVVQECRLFYECAIVHKNDVQPLELAKDIVERCYAKGDFHRIYYGEITHAWRRG